MFSYLDRNCSFSSSRVVPDMSSRASDSLFFLNSTASNSTACFASFMAVYTLNCAANSAELPSDDVA
ncbi:hypothetical protein Hanom_Chr15g01385511 [Helianthus anomalus]